MNDIDVIGLVLMHGFNAWFNAFHKPKYKSNSYMVDLVIQQIY